MPFLIPLLLQLCLGYTPLRAGLMMVPVAVAGMAVKRAVVPLIGRYGYRPVLVVNTVLVGLMMASFGLISPDQPEWLRVVQFALFGAVNSLQFTVMNTLTLRDLTSELASSGNSLLSMIMMVATGFGVAAAGSLLGAFKELFGSGETLTALPAFQITFVCVGLITLISTTMFWQLSSEPSQRPDNDATTHS